MAGFLGQVALGDEEREIGVDMAGGLEHVVQSALHLLPDGVAMRLDHHAAAHIAVLGQVGLQHQVIVPLRVVHVTGRQLVD
jgi:hypothetical protein